MLTFCPFYGQLGRVGLGIKTAPARGPPGLQVVRDQSISSLGGDVHQRIHRPAVPKLELIRDAAHGWMLPVRYLDPAAATSAFGGGYPQSGDPGS
jgi:hypothetical protein